MANLVLDIAYPPADPRQLIGACRAVGASGVAGYVWAALEGSEWSPAYVRALLEADLEFLPIDVLGDRPGPPEAIVVRLREWGLPPGPAAVDVERGAVVSAAELRAWCDAVEASGRVSVGYGPGEFDFMLGRCQRRWLASWRSAHQVADVDPAKWGVAAIQYDNDVHIQGLTVDVSAFDFHLIRRAVQAPPPWSENVSLILQRDPHAPPDARGLGAIYACDAIYKRYLAHSWEVDFWARWLNPGGTVITVPGEVIDRLEETIGPPLNQAEPAFDPSLMERKLELLQASVDGLAPLLRALVEQPEQEPAEAAEPAPLPDVPATPAAKAAAQELGVDLTQVAPGSGNAGTVTKADVVSAAPEASPP